MNLDIEKVPVLLNVNIRNLVFDLRAHYELSKRYGTLQKLVEEIKRESTESMPLILQIGFAHEEDVPIDELGLLVDMSNIKYLTVQTIRALMNSLPDPNKYAKNQIKQPSADEDIGWDWDRLYYMGTVLFGMSEAVFWRTLPRKLFALSAAHKEYHNPKEDGQADAGTTPSWVNDYI
ncbi:hypothetical protein ACM1RC_30445 [Paenibacillus azoreducens]|uniref:hypothetical protein n=1 Tax=Paenibacillus azoreducens TaxID=116718 RepID=UPI0039F513CD